MKQNNVQLIGYVGSDPGIKICCNGIKRACLRVATHYPLQNEGKGKLYGTTWHNVVAWDKHADHAERTFLKGSHIMVEGFLVYNKYPDKEGRMRYATQIKAHSLMNLDR